ncbi:MAG: TPM domain-containing protein [Candidatus Aminicenantes bacterium]|nr:TPM domain-containing protein [Candidatus Aminicenantes bacterium]
MPCGLFSATGFFLACVLASAAVQATGIPPAPDRWATDLAGFISPATRADIDSRLEGFERRTGHQVILYISRTTGDIPLEDFAARAFAAWKVGRKGLEDGLVLFIFSDDRKIRIEVGYGLEGVVTDSIAGRLIRDVLAAGIQRGEADAAVRDAVVSLLETIEGKPASDGERPLRDRDGGRDEIPPIFLIIGGVIFLILFITNPRLALWLLFSLLSGGRGSGGGGGGFRGGGGRSGGGGASGGW